MRKYLREKESERERERTDIRHRFREICRRGEKQTCRRRYYLREIERNIRKPSHVHFINPS